MIKDIKSFTESQMTKTNEIIFNFLILQYPLIHFFPLVPIYVLRAGDIKGKRDMVPTPRNITPGVGDKDSHRYM